MPTDLIDLSRKVKALVHASGQIIIEADARPRNIRHKGGNDLVTETDVAVEEFLMERLAKLLPGSTFLAEESSKDAELSNATWIIDPLDGTTNFAHRLPFVATSVGLWLDGTIALGVVNLPLLGELYCAVRGKGATCNDTPIAVTKTKDLGQSLVATGFPYDINTHLPSILRNLEKILPATRGVRRPGAAALDLAYVACGRYDGFWENVLNAWDTSAGVLLVEEAGGTVSRFEADVPYVLGDPTILATNGHIHPLLSELLCSD